jgi:hypothetical protein
VGLDQSVPQGLAPGPPYAARLDLTMDGIINVFDVVPFISLLGHRYAPWP